MCEDVLMAKITVALPFERPLLHAVLIDVQPHLPWSVKGTVHVHDHAQPVDGHVAWDGETHRCVRGTAGQIDFFGQQSCLEIIKGSSTAARARERHRQQGNQHQEHERHGASLGASSGGHGYSWGLGLHVPIASRRAQMHKFHHRHGHG